MADQTPTRVNRNRRIILFPLPYQGHINPMLQLANILYSKGFSITIFHTNFNAPNTSNYPHFTFKFILDNDPNDQRYCNLPLTGMASFDRIFVFNDHGADSLRHELDLEISKKDEPPVSCLITDALWYFTQSVADSVNLPRLVLRTSSLFCFLVYSSMPILHDRGYLGLANDNTTVKQVLAEFPVLKVKDIMKMGFKSSTDAIGGVLNNMVKQTKASSGIIWNSFKELEETEFEMVVRDIKAPSFLIPFPKHFTGSSSSLIEQDRTFFPWLDQQPPNSVVYVSFGSTTNVDEKDFLEIAHGLVDSGQPFLWVVRPGYVNGSTWIEPLTDGLVGKNSRIVKWTPQQEVLAHKAIGAFWTHNGWNSTLESVCEGVPMILSPFFGDQALNARYMSDVLKVGVYLGNVWHKEDIANAIRRIMVDNEGEEIRERAKVIKQKLDVSLIKGGSSYESLESLVSYVSSL
ncbi:UDP-glycosyltransferase 76G1-like [Rutidosis leptorrhynchoides]|uniref:UDP-glycosyltransferase 76G1-like n=1 Tax=Rutidosis leptorrhynchoides TaxID=125765 RepID=UPI003A99A1FA